MRLFVAMIVAFLVGSELSDKGAVVHHTVTGVVTQFEPGRSISVANEHMGRAMFPMALNQRTVIEGAPIAPGAVVALRYRRALGDPTSVLEAVRVLRLPKAF